MKTYHVLAILRNGKRLLAKIAADSEKTALEFAAFALENWRDIGCSFQCVAIDDDKPSNFGFIRE